MKVAELAEELSAGSFGDGRLNTRASKMANILGQFPNLSIPAALRSKAEIEGAYRFFNNERVTPDRILQPHIEATYKRIAAVDYVVLAQDTTELDLTRPMQQVAGAGPMDCETRRGAFFHPTIAFTSTGLSLGIVGQKSWTRQEISQASKGDKLTKRRQTPIEEKESYRWIEGVRCAERTAAACPNTTCVCVGDSESDIYEVFATALASEQKNLHLLVRAGQNRNTTEDQDWMDQVRQTPKIGERIVTVRVRIAKTTVSKSARSCSREARTAELEIRKATIELRRPIHGNKTLPASIRVNVVLCEEIKPPQGADPIRWMLVTTLPIATEAGIERVISTYCLRWQIEVYFRTLKSGCKIEHRRFETLDRVLNCLAFYSVIAWRVMYVCHLGRDCPELECEVLFEPSEWKSVYSVLKLEFPAQGCPPLKDVVRAIARLGGYINHPEHHPGTQTLWIGLQRTYDLSNAWETFGPGAQKIFS